MAEQWSLKKVDLKKVYKDLPLSTLQQWILEARIDAYDMLRRPGEKEWVSAAAVPELARFFSPQAVGSDLISSADLRNLFGRSGDDRVNTVVDLTPFIDITFLLLIFFIVTAQFSHQSMKIDPPSAKNTQARRQEKLVVVIQADGRVFMGKREVAIEILHKEIRREMERTLQQSVVIRSDRTSKVGVFVKVLDKCKEAGAKHVFVGAVKEKD